MFRVIAWIMLHLILLAFAWQWNDPDALLWMLVYGYAAIMTAMALQDWNSYWPVLGAIGCFAGFAWLIPAAYTPRYWYDVEPVREALGLLILAVWMSFLSVPWFRRLRPKAVQTQAAPRFMR